MVAEVWFKFHISGRFSHWIFFTKLPQSQVNICLSVPQKQDCQYSDLWQALTQLTLGRGCQYEAAKKMKRNRRTSLEEKVRSSSHLVGLPLVELVQGVGNSSLTGVHHELTLLPTPYRRVQVHVIHSTSNSANLISG